MRLGLAVVLTIVACAQVKQDPPRKIEAWETAGGSRLRPIFVTVGGVRQFVAFEDRVRGERCNVFGVGGGVAYCWPRAVQPSAFSETGCSVLNAALDERCDGTSALVQIGNELFTARPIDRAYVCDTPIEVEAGSRYVVAGDPVPQTAFVRFTLGEVDVGDRLRLVTYNGEDGSRYVLSFKDTKYETYCTFGKAIDGSTRCIPSGAPTAWDETCTDRVFVFESAVTPRAVSVEPKGCDAPRVYAASDLGEIRVAQLDASGKCTPLSRPYRAGRLGAEIASTELAAETRARVGDTRIKQWVRSVGVARLPGVVEDEELGTACYFALDAGAYRCLPTGLGEKYFDDDRCTSGFACLSKRCGDLPRYTTERAGRCESAVRSLGALRPAPERMRMEIDGHCGGVAGVTCDEHRDLGPIVPREKLATGNVTVE